ncbi:MscS Mechanosensitive ion channel [Methanoregula boonei 6A8]|jgi:small-conductance mechanosensitive channel|uniref:MscS Mechanosensitive ion channel n=1 Tax=Methanoregula boonei (strain DSM 21154 / JCM 14090 / 6A8) TaxID=456442 RepID=A7I7V7_METB6|nr:mechanosensitive ion channel domain-containing protein [Methanoregula boonei]ABS55818.1 MscS Mechanosensitive ion channel [Methanoregula boonei 6A8]
MNDNLLFAIATIIAGVVVAIIARIIVRWLEKFAETTETKWDDIIVAAIGTPVQIGIIAFSLYIALKYYDIVPAQYAWILSGKVLDSIYILLGTWIAASLLHDIVRIYGRQIAESTEGDMDDRIVDLLELAVRYVVWFAGIMLVMVNLEINITPFLAGAGIAGIALALAAQDLISNFFGGAIITVDKPFKVSDRIEVDTYYGDVLVIGTRSTRLRTLDGKIVTLPNNKITTNSVVNFSEPDPRIRYTIPITVAYGSDISRVKQVLLEVANDAIKNTDFFDKDQVPKVFFQEFGDSALNFIIYVWAKAYNVSDEAKDEINTRIAARFAAEGIEIPFPQIDVHVRK